jgi:peroxiredoxin/uncharacterized membrane protein YphA (DoxX/SURF4 family)
MELSLLISRLLLAGVFGVAGITKLADIGATRSTIRGFGFPAWFAAPASVVLPATELAVAVLLLPASTAPAAAAGAVGLLAAFLAIVVVSIARGRRPDCHCFGQLRSSTVGWHTVVRNGLLLGVAIFALWGSLDESSPSAWSWLGDLTSAEQVGLLCGAGLLVTAATGAWVVLGLLRQQGRLLLRIETLERDGGRAGSPSVPQLPVATDFSLPDLDGNVVSLALLRARGRPVLLVFTDPECKSCHSLLPEVATWQADLAEGMTVVAITRGDEAANREEAGRAGLAPMLVQEGSEVDAAFGVVATPSAVVVTPTGLIATPVVSGTDAIRGLVAHMASVLSLQSPVLAATGNGHHH